MRVPAPGPDSRRKDSAEGRGARPHVAEAVAARRFASFGANPGRRPRSRSRPRAGRGRSERRAAARRVSRDVGQSLLDDQEDLAPRSGSRTGPRIAGGTSRLQRSAGSRACSWRTGGSARRDSPPRPWRGSVDQTMSLIESTRRRAASPISRSADRRLRTPCAATSLGSRSRRARPDVVVQVPRDARPHPLDREDPPAGGCGGARTPRAEEDRERRPPGLLPEGGRTAKTTAASSEPTASSETPRTRNRSSPTEAAHRRPTAGPSAFQSRSNPSTRYWYRGRPPGAKSGATNSTLDRSRLDELPASAGSWRRARAAAGADRSPHAGDEDRGREVRPSGAGSSRDRPSTEPNQRAPVPVAQRRLDDASGEAVVPGEVLDAPFGGSMRSRPRSVPTYTRPERSSVSDDVFSLESPCAGAETLEARAASAGRSTRATCRLVASQRRPLPVGEERADRARGQPVAFAEKRILRRGSGEAASEEPIQTVPPRSSRTTSATPRARRRPERKSESVRGAVPPREVSASPMSRARGFRAVLVEAEDRVRDSPSRLV